MNILCVCLGNICRSPAAQAIFEDRIEKAGLNWTVDSAGTGAWHAGNPPDERMIRAAARRGYDLTPQRARKVTGDDFSAFDHILAMDQSNFDDLTAIAPADGSAEISLLLSHTHLDVSEVPDPYYGGESGFDGVINLISKAVDGFLETYAASEDQRA